MDLALAMADGEARYGDWRAALRALDAAEALAGALPAEYAQKRDLWLAELHGEPTLALPRQLTVRRPGRRAGRRPSRPRRRAHARRGAHAR